MLFIQPCKFTEFVYILLKIIHLVEQQIGLTSIRLKMMHIAM